MNIALIVMYMQNIFYREALKESMESISEKINYIIDLFRKNNKRIIWIQDEKEKYGNIIKTEEFEIIDILKPGENEKRIIQHYKNSFCESELFEYLYMENINTIIITGYYPEDCIFTTTTTYKGTFDYNVTPLFLKDAIAGSKEYLNVLEMISKLITIREIEKTVKDV